MSKKHDHVSAPLASSDRDIPQVAAEAFRAAHIKQGKLITEQVGDAPPAINCWRRHS